jgi:hypothetical protein
MRVFNVSSADDLEIFPVDPKFRPMRVISMVLSSILEPESEKSDIRSLVEFVPISIAAIFIDVFEQGQNY